MRQPIRKLSFVLMPFLALSGAVPAARGQQGIAKYQTLLQGLDNQTKAALDQISSRLSKNEAEGVLSRLPYGRVVHLKVPALPSFSSLQPGGQDPKVVHLSDLPSAPLEALLHQDPNFLPAYFLEIGVQKQRAVVRIRLKMPHDTDEGTIPAGAGWGTGFLVSDSLLISNHHVIEDPAFARDKAVAQFNFQVGLDGAALPVYEFDLDPDHGFYTSEALDFTIVRVKSKIAPAPMPSATAAPTPVPPGVSWGHIPMTANVRFAAKQPVNIIQHPAGRYKEIVLRENEITEISADVVRYTADTEPGSSGSPVFDNQWSLVALHHAAGKQEGGKWVSNEGIRIDRIISDLKAKSPKIAIELGLQAP
jgi:endonuclease G